MTRFLPFDSVFSDTVILASNGESFLGNQTRDWIAIAGLAGFFLTLIALAVGIYQLRKTTSANRAATEAAVQALHESKERYERYIVAQVQKFFAETRQFVSKEAWELAALRADDVAELVTQFATADSEWDELAGNLRQFATQFRRIRASEIQPKTIQFKWRRFESVLSRKVSLHHGPFQPVRGADNADGNKISRDFEKAAGKIEKEPRSLETEGGE